MQRFRLFVSLNKKKVHQVWLRLFLLAVANIFLFYASYPTVSSWLVLRGKSFSVYPLSTGGETTDLKPLKIKNKNSGQLWLAGPQALTYGVLEHVLFRPDVLSGNITALDIRSDQTNGGVVIRTLILRRAETP